MTSLDDLVKLASERRERFFWELLAEEFDINHEWGQAKASRWIGFHALSPARFELFPVVAHDKVPFDWVAFPLEAEHNPQLYAGHGWGWCDEFPANDSPYKLPWEIFKELPPCNQYEGRFQKVYDGGYYNSYKALLEGIVRGLRHGLKL
jgi:hypothetical protein